MDAGAVTTYTLRDRALTSGHSSRGRGPDDSGDAQFVRVQVVEEGLQRGPEQVGSVEHQMVIRAGDLDEPRARDLRTEPLRHRAREDRAPLPADDQRGSGDPREQRPAVDRLACGVAGRIEPIAEGAGSPDDALSR